MERMLSSSVESMLSPYCIRPLLIYWSLSLEKLETSAAELSETTGKTCLAAQADVRQPQQLHEAVKKTIDKFGRIDFVVCGWHSSFVHLFLIFNVTEGAAGNFLAPISGLSENAFRTVMEIDTVRQYLCPLYGLWILGNSWILVRYI